MSCLHVIMMSLSMVDSYSSPLHTAAEKLFEQKYGNLFEFLVKNVRIPGRPRNKTKLAREVA